MAAFGMGENICKHTKSTRDSVQSLSHVRLFQTPWMKQASVHHHLLLKLTSIEFVMPSNHLILCHPLLFLPSIYHLIRVFSSEWNLYIRWPTCWSFSFSISPSNENSGFDLLAVQGTLKSPLQHQLDSINSSMLSLCYDQTLTSHISQSDVSAF